MVPEAAILVMSLSGPSEAVVLGEKLMPLLSGLQSFLGSESCKRSKESKHSSDDIVRQLELSELDDGDPGVPRSLSSK